MIALNTHDINFVCICIMKAVSAPLQVCLRENALHVVVDDWLKKIAMLLVLENVWEILEGNIFPLFILIDIDIQQQP